jgi:hypothetical protein
MAQQHTSAELLTLQFGSYANFVGAHYWNLQVLINAVLSVHVSLYMFLSTCPWAICPCSSTACFSALGLLPFIIISSIWLCIRTA